MRVPATVSDCVCFVCSPGDDTAEDSQPIGTAFFIAYPVSGHPERSVVYAVTARHVIAGAAFKGWKEVWLRLNEKAGGLHYVKVPLDLWRFHPNDLVADDVAILRWAPFETLLIRSVPLDMLATPEALMEYEVGVGDEVFFPGLFVNHAGTERNLPIVRSGTIAALPAEPISTRLGGLPAYLIEARSIGGLSGSPVFVNLGLIRLPKDTVLLSTREDADASPVHDFLLVGLMHGHFTVVASILTDQVVVDELSDERVNMGLAIVLPVERIREVLNQEAFDVERADIARALDSDRSSPEPS